uniref:Uncharacterized protein n=1 Tax=Arundo donax TaxID=35708 RepID=A0A0A8Z7D2_ARUDO
MGSGWDDAVDLVLKMLELHYPYHQQ